MMASRPGAARRNEWIAPLFCIAAALCATFLSGINFPEQNNRWHIPLVLDFAGSAEGPHDAYSRSYANFVSLFWVIVRSFTDEGNIEAVFVGLQLAGNALLACAVYALIRATGQRPWPSALATGFLSFCYRLWGATRLGFSEVFVTYATHTQFAIILGIFAFALIVSRRPYWAAFLLGVAANVNLFMAGWAALACGLALVALARKAPTREQVGFSLIFLLLACPLALRALGASGGSADVPFSFYRGFLAGHVFGFDYPRALVQTFALALAACLGSLAMARDERTHRFAVMQGACLATLAIGTVMPYLTEAPLLLLLHPLRFSSNVMIVAAAGAAVMFAACWRDKSAQGLFGAALALAGFMLKLPLVSLFGFALAIPGDRPGLRKAALAACVLGILALFLPDPRAEISGKAALAFLLIAIVATAVAVLRPQGAPLHVRMTAAVLAGLAIMPLGTPFAGLAIVMVAVASALAFAPARWLPYASACALLSALLLLFVLRGDPMAAGLFGLGFAALAVAPVWARIPHAGTLATACLVALVPVLMLLGLARGAADGFAPAPTDRQRDFAAAQAWARKYTPPDTMFMPLGVEDGFSLLSRRPVWWEESYAAAILWQPGFYPQWERRRELLARATTPQEVVNLAGREGAPFVIASAEAARGLKGVARPYENASYAILRPDPSGTP